MKNHRLLMLIIACAVLDWLMLSSSRDQSKRVQDSIPAFEQEAMPTLIAFQKPVGRHKNSKRNATAAQILAQRAVHSSSQWKSDSHRNERIG
jgi:hypothetical protein